MKIKITLVFAIFLIYGCSAPVKIGTVVPPYPAKYKYIGGACVTNNTCEYALDTLSDGKNHSTYLLLEKTAGINEDGNPKWVVVSILKLPYKKNTFVSVGLCRYANQEGDFIITLLPTKIDLSNEYLSALYFAYKVQFPQQEFVKLNVNDVKCYNTALDADG